MFLQIIYLWLSQHNVGIYPTYNENISIEASTSMNEPFRCVNMVFIDVCRHAVGMHAVSSSRYEWVFVVARVDLFQFSSIIIFHTRGTPVWPNDEIKSCLIFPNNTQKVAKTYYTWKFYDLNRPRIYQDIWATFVREFVTKNIKNCTIWSHCGKHAHTKVSNFLLLQLLSILKC